MNSFFKLSALIVLSFLLSGCTVKNIEAQAYAVSLGMDLTGENKISVSVQVPALSQSGGGGAGGDSEGANGGGGYTFSQAEGETLTAALEMLNAGVPRELNLTGVKSVVVSEKLARSERFGEVLEELALAYRVYGAAEMVVCMGEAEAFIQKQEPVIGLRLSESTTVALSHYQEYGYIPSAKAADVFYVSRSFYGDPVTILAAGAESKGQEKTGNGADSYADTLPDTGEKQNRYFGSALFSEGRMVGRLTGAQTQLLNVLLGSIEYFSRVIDGVPVRINVSGAPRIQIDMSGNVPVIDVKLAFNMMESEGGLAAETLAQELTDGLNELTEYCQNCGSDPFRYAEIAARRFLTVQDWLEYDWKQRFPRAQIRYQVKVQAIEL